MRSYAAKVEVLAPNGFDCVRHVPAAVARALVDGGQAEVMHQNGRVRSVRLIQTAGTHAELIGPPTGNWLAPRFVVREKLEGGGTVWRHHARCTYLEPE